MSVEWIPGALMRVRAGADSMVVTARAMARACPGESCAVRAARGRIAADHTMATGRPVAGRNSVMCSRAGVLRMDDGGVTRPHRGVTDEPSCNGSTDRSAVDFVRTIGS